MKKMILSAMAFTAVLGALATTPASAHCGGSKYATAETCPVADCAITQNHRHDGKTYCGHYEGDGHIHGELCTVQNCANGQAHSYNATTCVANTTGAARTQAGGCHRGR